MLSSKEALEDIILYLNATEPKGLYCENIEVIKQDIERLEKLEKENQELKDKVNHYKNKFYTTHKSAESIKETIRAFINALDIKNMLTLDDKTTVKSVFNKVLQDLDRLEKLEKAIEILKEYPSALQYDLKKFKYDDINNEFYYEDLWSNGIYCLPAEKYKLLKEVKENDR